MGWETGTPIGSAPAIIQFLSPSASGKWWPSDAESEKFMQIHRHPDCGAQFRRKHCILSFGTVR